MAVEKSLSVCYIGSSFCLVVTQKCFCTLFTRDEVVRVGADYLFVWDSEARVTNRRTLQILMQYNRWAKWKIDCLKYQISQVENLIYVICVAFTGPSLHRCWFVQTNCGPTFGVHWRMMASTLVPMTTFKLSKMSEGKCLGRCVHLKVGFEVFPVNGELVVCLWFWIEKLLEYFSQKQGHKVSYHAFVCARVHLPSWIYFHFAFNLHVFTLAHFPLSYLHFLNDWMKVIIFRLNFDILTCKFKLYLLSSSTPSLNQVILQEKSMRQ